MTLKPKSKHTERFGRWTAIPPWVVAGAVILLVLILGVMARQNIVHQQQARLSLLEEKGAALIRAFEAGTRTGMMRMRWGRGQLQILLQETARQPDILYLLVVDRQGRTLFHSDPDRVGRRHGTGVDLPAVADASGLNTRRLPDGGDQAPGAVFEVYRRFKPLKGPPRPGRGRHRMGRHMRGESKRLRGPHEPPPGERDFWQTQDKGWVIFVGLDPAPVEAAVRAGTRQTLVVTLIMLLVGGVGLLLLFLGQQVVAARSSLERIKAFSDTLVARLPMGLVAVDEHDRISACNPTGARIVGSGAEHMLGRPAETALPAALWSQVATTDNRSVRLPLELEVNLDNGSTVPLEIVVSPLTDDQGRRQGTVVLFRDVSELQSLRKAVARSQRLAAVGRLAAGVAHEIRNPLSSIKGFATHFRQRYHSVPEDQSIADLMIGEVDRLNRVITQMIEFARPAAPVRRRADVNALVREAMALVASRADTHRHRVTFEPAPSEPHQQLDPDQIRQVLLNLCINALEAMKNDGDLTVTVAAADRSAGVHIRIADTGPGIDPSDHKRVFDPYYSTKPTGTGLGLAIVHNIVEAHQGKLSVDSRPGRGTKVTVFLPDAPAGPGAAVGAKTEAEKMKGCDDEKDRAGDNRLRSPGDQTEGS